MTERGTPVPDQESPSWWLFHGTGRPAATTLAERVRRWPPAPPWRAFTGAPDLEIPPADEAETKRRLGTVAVGTLTAEQLSVINAAIHLRRPLLITGGPGSGKSSLAYLIAWELGLGPVLRWPVTSRTTVRSGLYEYDAIGRAQSIAQSSRDSVPVGQPGREGPPGSRDNASRDAGPALRRRPRPDAPVPPAVVPVGRFVTLGPLGTALLPYALPRVLLVDEFDKCDYDLPNDLLTLLEDAEFDLPELIRVREAEPIASVYTADRGVAAPVTGGVVRAHEFPIVVITSNGERDFPEAFLRRCVRLDIPQPGADALADLVAAHFPRGSDAYRRIITEFVARRELGVLAADQLLNAAHLLDRGALDGDDGNRAALLAAVWRRLDPAAERE
ncbi:MoxR family ATPase [Frankia sp. CNm7]|uniref:MoxR family ATPase n=1 Tax=Frankia nepalensis TaxID=1836974 RepID=A0A937RGU9_9ACTN|nr:MoxR family ATPase [Frankia nepalensis]MBL7497793.1 MoxR family ATPase [Frankia nepalensis]MBL7511296.1 MoxR family ATPase [Frankia nepalensis]MBL7517683.1 MoxR family ATPase [Frankia nepalensis]MBL7629862.1 MoxR family ATPase [Frankia nepalensis]